MTLAWASPFNHTALHNVEKKHEPEYFDFCIFL